MSAETMAPDLTAEVERAGGLSGFDDAALTTLLGQVDAWWAAAAASQDRAIILRRSIRLEQLRREHADWISEQVAHYTGSAEDRAELEDLRTRGYFRFLWISEAKRETPGGRAWVRLGRPENVEAGVHEKDTKLMRLVLTAVFGEEGLVEPKRQRADQ
jgi:hypothetical protein